MKVVISIDSFKGSMSSMEAGQAAAEGVRRAVPGAEVIVRPLADGGEGTVEALVEGLGGMYRDVEVTGPLGEKVTARYGIVGETPTAVIEMSQAAGLPLVPAELRNPLYTTTYGVGEIIKDAVRGGVRKFIIGIGGSATNDGGAGMLQALGFKLSDAEGRPIAPGAIGLKDLRSISTEGVDTELLTCRFLVACDVDNPLCGARGASAVYGPQKGADEAMVREMDEWLEDFALTARTVCPGADPGIPGSGAAGGLGFAFRTFLGGELRSGIDIVLEETGLEGYIEGADYVVTGEGRLDFQTAMGKAPIGVARLAARHGARVIALAGSVTPEATECNRHGIDAFFPIVRGITTLEEAMDSATARANMTAAAEQVFRLAR